MQYIVILCNIVCYITQKVREHQAMLPQSNRQHPTKTPERALLHLPCQKSEQGHEKEIFVQDSPLAVPARHDRREYQHGNKLRKNSDTMNKERTKKKNAISFKRAYSIQIQAFLGVFCVRGIIILPTRLKGIQRHYTACTDVLKGSTR